MRNLFIFSLLAIVLTGCADMPMSRVMDRCNIGSNVENYSNYAYCLKATYTKEGNAPNAQSVRAFYAQLDVIDEYYKQGKITNAQAKSYAYRAHQETIEADNQSSYARTQALQNSLNALAGVGAQPSGSNQNVGTGGGVCFYRREWTSGFNKICVYNCTGSEASQTIKNTDFCSQIMSR